MICFVGAVTLSLTGCATSDAATRKAPPAKADTAQQQKPVKLRYYGGPKYPMYPE
jgi:hypothetical protein